MVVISHTSQRDVLMQAANFGQARFVRAVGNPQSQAVELEPLEAHVQRQFLLEHDLATGADR